MKYLGAYLLATLGGNASPTSKDILSILGAAGLDCDMDEANKIVSSLEGKKLEEVITEGKKKIATVPSGGGGGAPAAAASSAAPAAAAPAAKKEEPKEESDEDMGFGLFD